MSIEYHTNIKLVGVTPTDPEDVVTKDYVDEAGAKRFSEDIHGDGTKKDFPITHKLDTEEIVVSIWDQMTKRQVFADVEIHDGDNVTIGFADAPATGSHYKVVVL